MDMKQNSGKNVLKNHEFLFYILKLKEPYSKGLYKIGSKYLSVWIAHSRIESDVCSSFL